MISAIFPSSPGWKRSGPRCTQSREPLMRSPMPGQQRHEEERNRAEAEQVLVVLEHAEVAAQPQQREREHGDADHDPRPLAERVLRAEPVDLGHADCGEQRRNRQHVRIGVRER